MKRPTALPGFGHTVSLATTLLAWWSSRDPAEKCDYLIGAISVGVLLGIAGASFGVALSPTNLLIAAVGRRSVVESAAAAGEVELSLDDVPPDGF